MPKIDYDKLIKKEIGDTLKDHIVQNPKHLPQWPFRMIISGPSGCGKTTLLLDLLMDEELGLNYHTLHVFAKDLEEEKYQWLEQRLAESEAENQFSDELDDLPNLDELDPTMMHLFVFDDMVNTKNQDKIKEFFMRGRKKNCSMIYITQKYHAIPTFIRENANYTVIFKPPTNRIMTTLYQDCGGDCETIQDFKKLVDQATTAPYGYLVFDTTQKKKQLRYRCGFLRPSEWNEK